MIIIWDIASKRKVFNGVFYIFQSQHIVDIKTSVLYVNNTPNLITLDYEMDVSDLYGKPSDQMSSDMK